MSPAEKEATIALWKMCMFEAGFPCESAHLRDFAAAPNAVIVCWDGMVDPMPRTDECARALYRARALLRLGHGICEPCFVAVWTAQTGPMTCEHVEVAS